MKLLRRRYEQVYGGIHYRAAIEGIVQGKEIGDFVVNKLKMTK
jgi:hypothetical protein